MGIGIVGAIAIIFSVRARETNAKNKQRHMQKVHQIKAKKIAYNVNNNINNQNYHANNYDDGNYYGNNEYQQQYQPNNQYYGANGY